MHKICQDAVNTNGAHWDGVDSDLKALVLAMLQKDPDVRPSAADLLHNNAWVRKHTAGESSCHHAEELCQAAGQQLTHCQVRWNVSMRIGSRTNDAGLLSSVVIASFI